MDFSSVDLISSYFPEITEKQQKQLADLQPLYTTWNERINVVSKKDIHNLYLHHVLHSLSIAKVFSFPPQARILDLGTGGGFPGLPLAILCPRAYFTLIDGKAKKIKVVQAITHHIKLENVTALPVREGELTDLYDFVVTRAVAPLDVLHAWTKKLLKKSNKEKASRGLIALKGGDITAELAKVSSPYVVYPISDYFAEPYFLEKKLVHLY